MEKNIFKAKAKFFVIFASLITGICSSINSFSSIKDKAPKECGQILTDSCHKHVLCGSPNFDMELIIKSPKHGTFTVFYDEEDHELVSGYRWGLLKYTNGFYAEARDVGCKKNIRMHALITGIKGADHINRNGLDNRRCNLRAATFRENGRNKKAQKNNRAGFKGVIIYPNLKNCYKVAIMTEVGLVQGGFFNNIYAAALKYNELAVRYFGEFAYLNVLTDKQLEESKKIIPVIFSTNTSGYRGVKYNAKTKRYSAHLYSGGKRHYLGTYVSKEDAALSYNKAVLKYGKPDKFLNVIEK